MRNRNLTPYLLLLLLVLLNCGRVIYRYENRENLPNMVYVGSEIKTVKSGEFPKPSEIYAEVLTKSGIKINGRLLRITDRELVISRGFFYRDSTNKVEDEVSIDRSNILVLKLW